MRLRANIWHHRRSTSLPQVPAQSQLCRDSSGIGLNFAESSPGRAARARVLLTRRGVWIEHADEVLRILRLRIECARSTIAQHFAANRPSLFTRAKFTPLQVRVIHCQLPVPAQP
jgi:hypothetical protein